MLKLKILWPFPDKVIISAAKNCSNIIVPEMNMGQMVEDVRLAINGKIPVDFYGRMGGVIPVPEEILEVMTLRQLGYHKKPIVFINTNNFFEHLFKQFEITYQEMFAKETYRKLYFVANNSEEAFEYITNYSPVELDSKWFEVPKK